MWTFGFGVERVGLRVEGAGLIGGRRRGAEEVWV